jgi:glycosyltransferase involved in cell wall biosynthesis
MNVCLLSIDNPYKVHSGGKHVHLLLLEKGILENNINISTFYFPNSMWNIRQLWRLFGRGKAFEEKIKHMISFFNKIDFSQYDIINAHDVVSAAGANYQTILTLHGYFAREAINDDRYSETSRTQIYNLAMDIEYNAISKAKAIITVDNRIKNYVVKEFSYPENKIFVIYNSVDTNLFSPVVKNDVIFLRKKLGIPENKFVVLVPRRYIKKNGVIYAAKSLKFIKDDDVYYIFIGRGPEKDKVMMELKDDMRAVVMGEIPHNIVPDYYKAADVVLIPSITTDGIEEATSLSMLEGMSCGKVVICSDIGGMRETISSWENGILVQQKSPENIAEYILKVRKDLDLYNKIGNMARKYILKNHSYKKHAEKFIEVYKCFL